MKLSKNEKGLGKPKVSQKSVLIIGLGEVGSSLFSVLDKTKKFKIFKRDIEPLEAEEKIDVMHICINYSDKFVDIVSDYIKKYKPALTIINSTVRPFTTNGVFEKTRARIAHSPIRGMHPQMEEGILKFVKFIGPIDEESARLAKEHFESAGIKAEVLKSPLETELGKLFETTYYALCIAYHQELGRICEKYNVDFEQAVTRFNLTYNDVYKILKPNVVRPVLFPGFIGGHCLIPNINILKKDIGSKFFDVILESNEKKKRDIEKNS